MNRMGKLMMTVCGAAMLSSGAFAQDYGRDRDMRDRGAYVQDRYDRDDRGGAWDRERMSREYRGAFYDRLQSDLARAENSGYLRGDDRARFGRAHREVGEFQAKWSRGYFDAREMDEAIGSVQRVLEIPSLRGEDRQALREDLFAMRRFRSHLEGRR